MFKRGLSLALLSAVIVTISTPWATSQQESQQKLPFRRTFGTAAKGTKLPAIWLRSSYGRECSVSIPDSRV